MAQYLRWVVRRAVYVERFVVEFSVRLEFLCCEVKCGVNEVSGSLVGMGRNCKVEVAENLYKRDEIVSTRRHKTKFKVKNFSRPRKKNSIP